MNFRQQVEYDNNGLACRIVFSPALTVVAVKVPIARPTCEKCGAEMLAGQLGWVCSRGCEGRPITEGCPDKEIHHERGWIQKFGAAVKGLEQ